MAIDPYENISDTQLSHYESLSKENQRARELEAEEAKETQTQEQYVKTQEDARDNPEGCGVRGLAKEAQSILSGGLQETASSIAT